MFGRRKAEDETLPAQPIEGEPVETVERPGAKNRPTPKRRDQEAARKRPLVPDKRSMTKADKARARTERTKAREAMMRGEEKYLHPRDKGPVRRLMRDMVDARWNIGEILLPAMLVVLALSFIRQPWAQLGVFVVVYGLLAVGVLDAVLLWRRVKGRVREEFDIEPPKGSVMYVVLRAFQMRRSRMPRPAVDRGTEVRRRR